MRDYPDISELIKMKNEWRKHRMDRPISEKIESVNRMRKLSREIPKLTRNKSQVVKADKRS